jgi:hypothetical protein
MGVKLGLWPQGKVIYWMNFKKIPKRLCGLQREEATEGCTKLYGEKLRNTGSTNWGTWGLGMWKYNRLVHNPGTRWGSVTKCTSRGHCCPRKKQNYLQNTRMAGQWEAWTLWRREISSVRA